MASLYDIDAHGRVVPQSEEARRALADRAGRFALLPSTADLLLARRTPTAGGATRPPRCMLAGDLSCFPIADFIAFVHQSRLSGQLSVSSGGVERSVLFRDGEVRNATSEATSERIGEVALRLGYVTAEQLEKATAGGRPLGKVLVDLGFISAADLWKCFHEQVTAIFHAILLAREGVFFLVDEPPGDRPGAPLSVSTQSLLMDGIRRIDEMSLFRARIPAASAFLRRREPHRPITLQRVEQEMLELVDGRRRVADVAAAAHLAEFDATKILFHLAEAGYVEASVEAAAAAADTAASRLDAIAERMNALLREVIAELARGGVEADFWVAVRAFLADPASRFAPLWKLVVPSRDGSIDKGPLLGNLAALRGTALQAREPGGDPARFLYDGLRELLFFYLFLAGERLSREADDALGSRVKGPLEALEALR